MPTTQEVFDHHVAGFVARDVAMILEDYSDASVLIANGETFKGRSGITRFFEGLFAELPKDCPFNLTACEVLNGHVYITWNAEGDGVTYDFATDTFAIEDGTITLQTIGFVKHGAH